MTRISPKRIKQIVNSSFGVKITEKGAERIAEILEKEAKSISSFAVQNAIRNKRGKVTKKDIKDYVIRRVLDGK
ncbi:MAG: hypothetical protein KGH69_02465 [Candidatus Micrarchaeota archaeon]|nr:hypothetical protein [Candidatus Micrarchaeota archaeon]